ncbi:MAG: tetratricopeptide repeat protein [Pyrinomonadaceae bacterium]
MIGSNHNPDNVTGVILEESTKIQLPKLKQVFLFAMVLALPAVMASWLAAPGHAQQKRKTSQESEAGARYAETADRLAEQNKWPEAIDAYKLVIQQHPKYTPAYRGLGDAYLNTGRSEAALAIYKEAVRLAPNDAEAWYDLGYFYNFMGRHGEAFAPLVKATQLDSGFAEAFYGIGYAYLRGSEIEKSLPWLKSATSLYPDYADAYYGLALVYTRLGKSNLADESRKKLLTLDANLVRKLDKEVRTPQSTLAGLLPPIIPESQLKTAAVAQHRASETPQPTPHAEAPKPPPKTDIASPSAPSQQVSQPAPVSLVVSDKASTSIDQPRARTDLPAGRDTDTASRQLPQPEPEPPRQVPGAPASSVSPAPQVARVDGATEPAPPESAAQPTVPAAVWPVAAWPAKAKRWALVIGVDNYIEEQSSTWQGSANDARILGDALVQYAGFPSDQVIVLSPDQPSATQPRRNTILKSLSSLRGRVPQDGLLLFFFAGHGIERNGRSYLVPSDAPALDDLSLLEYTGVNVDLLKELIRATGVRQVLMVLDASKNDPTPGRSAGDNPMTSNFSRSFNFDLNRREVTSFATLYATAVGQRAYGYGGKKQGYFTWALVEGLRGEAANEKGEVTLASLMKFVQETVPKYVQRDLGGKKQQVPFAVIEGYKADELVIATAVKKVP